MTASPKTTDIHQLDALTGGAFTAPTSGERATRIRAWLSGEPTHEQLQEVFRELAARDKGAARPVRERLDDIRRAKGQQLVAAEWAAKAHLHQRLSQHEGGEALDVNDNIRQFGHAAPRE